MNPPSNYKKATQALNYFASICGGQINKMKALKLIYFADKYHLRKYGRLITNDTYYAMANGPVASSVRDIAGLNTRLDSRVKEYAERYIRPVSKYTYESIADVDRDVDIEALQFAFETFGHLTQFKLADMTHAYPEWKKHEQELDIHLRANMDIKDFLEDPPRNTPKCFELDAEDKKVRREQIREAAKIEALWR